MCFKKNINWWLDSSSLQFILSINQILIVWNFHKTCQMMFEKIWISWFGSILQRLCHFYKIIVRLFHDFRMAYQQTSDENDVQSQICDMYLHDTREPDAL